MEEKLKPCPFCGGEAELINIDAARVNGICNPITVRCKECNCNVNWFCKEQKAIEVWNRRTSNEKK